MPTLNWIGKDAVINHHKEVPFRLLKCRADLSVGEADSGNLLVQGDNLEALKALLPYYAGQVKCIYIDPPYNTGNEGWVYNDNVNSVEMRDWLGKVVGGESEDLSRHDKWLSMMYPRLVLLHQMLSEDGAIFISIDDNEVSYLRAIMDEIYGEQNFIATIVWQKMHSPKNTAKHLSVDHEYILLYAKKAETWRPNLLQRTEKQNERYTNPDNDLRGVWTKSDLSARNYYSLGTYEITTPSGRVISGPPKGRYWTVSKENFDKLVKDNRIWWGKDGTSIPMRKRFLSEVKDGVVPQTLWFHVEAGNTREAKQEIVKLLPTAEDVFNTPKPTRLIKRIIQLATDKDSIVLDSFAGSGTTGHAVLQQNIEDGGNRKFVLIEIDEKISKPITVERIKRAVNGYGDIVGLNSGFRFCELGTPLFDPNRQIQEEVKYNDLAQHIYFIETGLPLPPNAKKHFPLLGVSNETAVYLLYNGILKDKSVNGGNVLTYDVLEGLPSPAVLKKEAGLKVIYGNGCRISKARLRELGIVFKQIPYEIREM